MLKKYISPEVELLKFALDCDTCVLSTPGIIPDGGEGNDGADEV